MKTSVVPEQLVHTVARTFRPLFFAPVVVVMLGGFFALDVWLFVFHGVAQSLRQTLYDPLFILLLLALVAASAAFHECGHATACAYGGARPGVMGVGIYIVWPAFYTDVTDAYRLGKGGRLRTDLGGVYFNSIFSLATFGVYFLTRWEPLLLVVPLQIMEMLHQFLPFIRLDGYYIVSDLTGVPDMFSRIKPTLKSLNPLDETPQEVRALKPWVRVVVTVYVFTVVPLLLFLLALTVINTPRIVATAWASLALQNHRLHEHVAAHAYLHVAVDALQMAILVLPVAGLFAMLWKLGKTLVTGAWSRTEGRRLARVFLVAAAAVGTAFAAYTWLPGAGYTPIAQASRGTIGGGISGLSHMPHPGSPLFGRHRRPSTPSPRVESPTRPAPTTAKTDTGASTTSGFASVPGSTAPAATSATTGRTPTTPTTNPSSRTSTASPTATVPNSATTGPTETVTTSTTTETAPTTEPTTQSTTATTTELTTTAPTTTTP
jgi:putative peptide zinc metalloprotease protein